MSILVQQIDGAGKNFPAPFFRNYVKKGVRAKRSTHPHYQFEILCLLEFTQNLKKNLSEL